MAFITQTPKSEEDYSSQICVQPTDSKTIETINTPGSKTGLTWGPEGQLAYLKDSPEDTRGKDIWLRKESTVTRRVTETGGNISEIAWAPDGSKIVFVQRSTPTEREEKIDIEAPPDYDRSAPDPRVIDRIVYRGQQHYFDGERSQIYIYDFESDEVTRITGGDNDYVGPQFGDSKTIFYTGKVGAQAEQDIHFDVIKYDLNTGTETTIATTTSTARPGTSSRHPAISATTDNQIAFTYTYDKDESDPRKTIIKTLEPDENDPTPLTASINRTIEESPGIQWGQENRYIYSVSPISGSYVLQRTDTKNRETEHIIGDAHVSDFDVSTDQIIYTKSNWEHPGDVFTTSADGKTERRVSRVNDQFLANHTVRKPEEVNYIQDGTQVQGWLLLPPEGVYDPPHPLIVEIHGGPHTMWTTSGSMWHEFQALAAAGYAVFWSNPRGSRGYGQSFARAIAGQWGEVTLTDILAGVNKIEHDSRIADEEMFVTGGSFGGYMIGWTVSHSDRFKAAIAQRGIYDLGLWYGTTDGSKQIDFDFGTVPWDDTEILEQNSPANDIENIDTPTLVMHSEEDYRVPPCNSELFYVYMKKAGIPTQLIRYPREGHELSRSGEPQHIVDRLQRIIRWFDGYVSDGEVRPVLEAGWDLPTRKNPDTETDGGY
jgi:dipeptidyl aminopeptidase/acylaminoacyl peptidase